MKQYDVFGNANEVVQKSHRTPTMQDQYGTIDGKTCKTCAHLYGVVHGNVRWYKCELWMELFKGHSAASDIRLSDMACGRYEEDK